MMDIFWLIWAVFGLLIVPIGTVLGLPVSIACLVLWVIAGFILDNRDD